MSIRQKSVEVGTPKAKKTKDIESFYIRLVKHKKYSTLKGNGDVG